MTATRLLVTVVTLAIAAPTLAGCQLGGTAAPQSTLPGTAGPGAGEASVSSAEPEQQTSGTAPAGGTPKQPATFVPPTQFTGETLNYSNSPNPGGTSIIFPVPEGWQREEFKTDKDRHGEDNLEIAFADPTGQVMLRVEKASPAQCCDPETVLGDKAALLFEDAPGYQQVPMGAMHPKKPNKTATFHNVGRNEKMSPVWVDVPLTVSSTQKVQTETSAAGEPAGSARRGAECGADAGRSTVVHGHIAELRQTLKALS